MSRRKQSGAGIAEFIVGFPVFMLLSLGTIQGGLLYHAKSSLNYAAHEAARAGSTGHAAASTITTALQKALIPYYGGGRNTAELASSWGKVVSDWGSMPARIEVISPTPESFDDYAMTSLQNRHSTAARVIPNTIVNGGCPAGKAAGECVNTDPASNQSGQSLADANLLKLRITYGVPPQKLVPFVGRFMNWALDVTGAGAGDPIKQAMIDQGRIPLVAQATIRMQSDAFENSLMQSNPGAGNNGTPSTGSPGGGASSSGGTSSSSGGASSSSGSGTSSGGSSSGGLPSCPAWDPTCNTCPTGQCDGGLCP